MLLEQGEIAHTTGRLPAVQSDAVLVAMPWTVVRAPSIQIGLLKAVLERHDIGAAAFHFYVDFFNLVATQVRGGRVSVSRFESFGEVFGEWTFSVPPFRELRPAKDEQYRTIMTASEGAEHVEMAFRVRSLVPGFLARCADEILRAQPKVVGFSTTFQQTTPSLVLARLLKLRRPDLRIVFGGANCEGPMGEALHRLFPWIDVVVRGEGEHVAPRLFRELLDGSPISEQTGLCFRRGDARVVCADTVVDDRETAETVTNGPVKLARRTSEVAPMQLVPMDTLPLPVYDDYFERLAHGPLADADQIWLPYESARGCWWAITKVCTFCAANAQYLSFRSKQPQTVQRDVVELSRRYGSRRVWFVDNIMEERYLRELFPAMRETPVPMFVETRAHVSKEHLELMRDAGVMMVQLGIESFSSPILKLIDKGTSAIQNIRIIKWCAELGIKAFYNVIYGFPGEPPEEYERMADAIKSLTHLEPPNPPVRLRLDRFSPYHRDPDHYGIDDIVPFPSRGFVYDLPVDELRKIEYFFAFHYRDGRRPDDYMARFKDSWREWNEVWQSNFRRLSHHQQGDELRIYDRRSNIENRLYELSPAAGRVYAACDAGTTPRTAWESLTEDERAEHSVEAVTRLLDDLTERRLMFHEGEYYLALAVSGDEQWRALQEGGTNLPVERVDLDPVLSGISLALVDSAAHSATGRALS
jgi:ribosomal peptide maturation radical SAM protein 1